MMMIQGNDDLKSRKKTESNLNFVEYFVGERISNETNENSNQFKSLAELFQFLFCYPGNFIKLKIIRKKKKTKKKQNLNRINFKYFDLIFHFHYISVIV